MPNHSPKHYPSGENRTVDELFDVLEELVGHCDAVHVRERIERLIDRLSTTPDESSMSAATPEQSLVSQAQSIMQDNILAPLTTQEIALECNVSATKLKKSFRYVTGMAIQQWFRMYRIELSKELLKETNLPIAQIAASVGYSNPSKFTKAFQEQTGSTPSAWRNS